MKSAMADFEEAKRNQADISGYSAIPILLGSSAVRGELLRHEGNGFEIDVDHAVPILLVYPPRRSGRNGARVVHERV